MLILNNEKNRMSFSVTETEKRVFVKGITRKTKSLQKIEDDEFRMCFVTKRNVSEIRISRYEGNILSGRGRYEYQICFQRQLSREHGWDDVIVNHTHSISLHLYSLQYKPALAVL